MVINKIKSTAGKIEPLGVSRDGTGTNFAFVSQAENCGIILYDIQDEREIIRISIPEEYRIGDIHAIRAEGSFPESFLYEFYEEDGTLKGADLYARKFRGRNVYGETEPSPSLKGCYEESAYDWEGDRLPGIAYENMTAYCLHVRGFTKHSSSKVKQKGTFAGIIEKIPYLKELGITTLELQPIYEYDEVEGEKLNYWGYKKGYYYSPKNSFAATEDASAEFKDLIKNLHKNGMEAVLQFYFPREVTEREISDILRYWVTRYHVDGIHLKGERVPISLISDDPCFAGIKIWYHSFEAEGKKTVLPSRRKKAIYADDFRYDMRRYLKGDEGLVTTVLAHMRNNPPFAGKINYLTNYEGFTLMDLVSYERKHNEDNGEDNKDGNDYNFSWNCGVEGRSRKKAILALRRKQIKNALCLLFFSQGTPLFFMGDEFGNSQKGNNNPYCQDNEITWLDWRDLEANRDIFEFVKELISLRKAHPILGMENQLRLMDYISCGYPDLSYHGEEPWKADMGIQSRQIGMMLCGKYSKTKAGKEDEFFYLGFNMHWEKHAFALPRLPKDLEWQLLLCTEEETIDEWKSETGVILSPRSAAIFISKEKQKERRKR